MEIRAMDAKQITDILLSIKEDLGDVKNEQKTMKDEIKVLSEILQRQVLHEEKIIHIEKDIDLLKTTPKACHKEDRFLALEQKIDNTKEIASVCQNEQNVKNMQKEIERMKDNFNKIAFALIPTVIAIIGLAYKVFSK
jgi:hypothetical protein